MLFNNDTPHDESAAVETVAEYAHEIKIHRIKRDTAEKPAFCFIYLGDNPPLSSIYRTFANFKLGDEVLVWHNGEPQRAKITNVSLKILNKTFVVVYEVSYSIFVLGIVVEDAASGKPMELEMKQYRHDIIESILLFDNPRRPSPAIRALLSTLIDG